MRLLDRVMGKRKSPQDSWAQAQAERSRAEQQLKEAAQLRWIEEIRQARRAAQREEERQVRQRQEQWRSDAGYYDPYTTGTITTGTTTFSPTTTVRVVQLPDSPIPPDEVWEIDQSSYSIIRRKKNQIKPTVHKGGHFPVEWMLEGHERAMASDKVIRIQLEKEGVVVIGTEGDNYETHSLPWVMMECAEVNPIPLAIETVEKHLNTLYRLKSKVKAA